MTPARPVLFDMDGTLTDSLAIITACFDRTMREEAGVVHEPAFYRRFIGPPLHDSFAELGVADPARFVAEYRRRYAETMLDTPLFPGVRELLERLDAAGVSMVVATSKKEEAARAIVEHPGRLPPISWPSAALRSGRQSRQARDGRGRAGVLAVAGDRSGRPR